MAIVLLGYVVLKSLIYSAMKPSFPNFQFILIIISMFVLTLAIGLSVRKYIKKTANGNLKIESNLKLLFVYGSVIASLCLLSIFVFV